MMSLREWIFSAAVCSACWGCGDRPEPPGPAVANAGEDDEVTVQLDSQPPRPVAEAAPVEPASPPDAGGEGEGAPAVAADAGAPAAEPAAGGPVLAACLADGGGCSIINVAVLDEGADSCIELVVDNCGTFTRAGIRVDTPVTWRLGSATVGAVPDEGCAPGAYDADSTVVVDGSGRIGWNLETRRPSDLVIDAVLEAASGSAVDSPVSVVGTFAGALPDCDP